MSHKYICDCCGENLYQFDENDVGHFKTRDGEKDFCPYCTDEIVGDAVETAITRSKRVFTSIGTLEQVNRDKLIQKIDDYNSKIRRW